jgi:predicted GIY-YIG superfamily endonuclease
MRGESLDLKGKSGIYVIINLQNGKRYIGSAVDMKQRLREHRSMLQRGKHHNKHLQNAYNKYGIKSFTLVPLELCDSDQLIVREQHYLDTEKPEYNKCPVAGSTRGRYLSEETRRKISEALSKTGDGFNRKGDKHPMYGIRGGDSPNAKPVYQVDKNTNMFIARYRCIGDAARITNTSESGISACINYRQDTAGGYRWLRTNEDRSAI